MIRCHVPSRIWRTRDVRLTISYRSLTSRASSTATPLHLWSTGAFQRHVATTFSVSQQPVRLGSSWQERTKPGPRLQTPATWGARRAYQDAASTPGPPSRPLRNPVWRSLRLEGEGAESYKQESQAPRTPRLIYKLVHCFQKVGTFPNTPECNLNVTEARCSPIISNQYKSISWNC